MGEREEGDMFLTAMADLRRDGGVAAPSHPIEGLNAEALSPES